MIRLEIKTFNTILVENQQKHHYHLEKLINMSNFQVNKYSSQIKIE